MLAIALLIGGAALRRADSRPEALAATVNGWPVGMPAYLRQLRFASRGYTGPTAPAGTATGRILRRMLANHAIEQAVAAVLIERTAAQRHLRTGAGEIARELARMVAAAGGRAALQAQARAAGMTVDDVRWVAEHNVLRARLAALFGDSLWLDHRFAAARIVYYVGDGATTGTPQVALGHPAPPFVGRDLRGRTVSLADVPGRAVVLTFWATWCTRCLQELPMLLAYARAHPDVAVVTLNRGEAAATVRVAIAAHRLRGLTVWLDDGRIGDDYTVSSLPVTFFIDRHGIMRGYTFGPLASADALREQAGYAIRGVDHTF